MAIILCPECKKEISDKATVCPECGYSVSYHESLTYKNPALAAVLSLFFWGGSGQIYNGQFWPAIGLYIANIAFTFLLIAGLAADNTGIILLGTTAILCISIFGASYAYQTSKSINYFLSSPSPFVYPTKEENWSILLDLYERYLNIFPYDQIALEKRDFAQAKMDELIHANEAEQRKKLRATQDKILAKVQSHLSNNNIKKALAEFENATKLDANYSNLYPVNTLIQNKLKENLIAGHHNIFNHIISHEYQKALDLFIDTPDYLKDCESSILLHNALVSLVEKRYLTAANMLDQNMSKFYNTNEISMIINDIRNKCNVVICPLFEKMKQFLSEGQFLELVSIYSKIPKEIAGDDRLSEFGSIFITLKSLCDMNSKKKHILAFFKLRLGDVIIRNNLKVFENYFFKKTLAKINTMAIYTSSLLIILFMVFYYSDYNTTDISNILILSSISANIFVFIITLFLKLITIRRKPNEIEVAILSVNKIIETYNKS